MCRVRFKLGETFTCDAVLFFYKYLIAIPGFLYTVSWYNISKFDPHLPKKCFIICFNDSPSKVMKNVFYSILKALFFSRYLKNGLIRKIRLILKLMMSQPGWQTITIHDCSISPKLKTTRP